jgi:hypothetical protein
VKHTPEPWRVTPEAAYISSDAGYVPITSPFREGFHQGMYGGATPEARANTERIVTCVNTCAGITNEALENGAISDLLKAAKLAADTLDILCDYLEEQGLAGHIAVREGAITELNRAIGKVEGY